MRISEGTSTSCIRKSPSSKQLWLRPLNWTALNIMSGNEAPTCSLFHAGDSDASRIQSRIRMCTWKGSSLLQSAHSTWSKWSVPSEFTAVRQADLLLSLVYSKIQIPHCMCRDPISTPSLQRYMILVPFLQGYLISVTSGQEDWTQYQHCSYAWSWQPIYRSLWSWHHVCRSVWSWIQLCRNSRSWYPICRSIWPQHHLCMHIWSQSHLCR